jgi:hypothetical protein
VRTISWAVVLAVILTGVSFAFDYTPEISGTDSGDLSINLASSSPNGNVTVNGADLQPLTGFVFDWGDGTTTTGFFPASHTYTNVTKNYTVTVTALQVSGSRPTAQLLVLFVNPVLTNPPLPAAESVTIPDAVVTLSGRLLYPPPAGLSFFDDTYFPILTRTTAEGLLSLGGGVQSDFVNNDHILINNRFDEVVLRDPAPNAGGGAIWWTNPIAESLGSGSLTGSIDWNSLFHEMGHNHTLNFPASFMYGGNIDGNANAIYAETLAQIFSSATIYELVNNNAAYGIPDDLALQVGLSGKNNMKSFIVADYNEYVSSGMPFCSWNDPTTPQDETETTFMTLAYKFVEHAETEGMGYKQPVQRMMLLLGTFNAVMLEQYDPRNNSQTGATYRSTLMVAALSCAFQKDLRTEFKALNFPIDDQAFVSLISSAPDPIPLSLTVANLGAGSGTVTSSPSGINCGTTCSASYSIGTVVTLTATPNSGSIFTGWSGACQNTSGACVVTMNAAQTVTADYTIPGIIPLSPGWNLVSLPKQPANTAITSVLSGIAGAYEVVWAYPNQTWKVYDPNDTAGSTLTTMQVGNGYWIKMTSAKTLDLSGSSPSTSIPLLSGWNLVGYNGTSCAAPSTALSSISANLQVSWGYPGQVWQFYDPANSSGTLTQLCPNYGYWINVNEAGTWSGW